MHSSLVTYQRKSPNITSPRNAKIDTVTVHHVAGDASVEALGALFAAPERQASANYGIGSDGRIACYVEEEDRSWCSGDRENDHRAITIEVANSGGAPDWPVSDLAWNSLVDLCEDICRRYDFRLRFTGDKTGNLTMHKWFQATECPGPYLSKRFPELERLVNSRLDGAAFYRVQVGAFREKANAEALQKKLESQGYDAIIVPVT